MEILNWKCFLKVVNTNVSLLGNSGCLLGQMCMEWFQYGALLEYKMGLAFISLKKLITVEIQSNKDIVTKTVEK